MQDARETVAAGLAKLDFPAGLRSAEAARLRRLGGGNRPMTDGDPGLLATLESLVERTSQGDPESPRHWTTKSTRHLATVLNISGERYRLRDRRLANSRQPPTPGQPNREPRESRRGGDRVPRD